MLSIKYLKLVLILVFAVNCDANVFFCWKCDARNKLECNRIGQLEKVRAFVTLRE